MLGLAVVTAAAYARFLSAGFAATDSLALVESSRLHNLGDVLQTFSQPVMQGTSFVSGEIVYRPFVSLTFALEYAMWGLQGAGYHVTNLLLHVLGVLSIWVVLTRLGVRRWAAIAGAGLFALHPLVVASVPVIARRDSLVPVTGFSASLALLVIAEQSDGARRRWMLVGSILLFAVALLSKESAFAALAMLPMLLLCFGLSGGLPAREAVRRLGVVLPYVLVGAVVFAIRLVVLRGLGGPGDTASILNVDSHKYAQTIGAFTRVLLWQFAGLAPSTREVWPRLAGLLVIGLAATLPWLPRRHAVLCAAGGLWIAGYAVFSMVLKIETVGWLAYFSLFGVALLFAAGLEGAVERLRNGLPGAGRRSAVARSAAALLIAGLGSYALSGVPASAVLHNYYQWQLAGDVTDRYMQALGECIGTDPRVQAVDLSDVPSSLDDGQPETGLMGVTLLQDWTITAALRLVYPGVAIPVHVESWYLLNGSADSLHFSCSRQAGVVKLTTLY